MAKENRTYGQGILSAKTRRGIICFIIMLLFSLTLALCLPVTSFTGRAANAIGKVNNTEYNNFPDLVKAIKNQTNTYIYIDMYRDWDANYDSQFNELIEIKSGKVVTFNMNGHLFNRNIAHTTYKRNGELIYLGSGSTLTINGGNKSETHGVYMYSSTDTSKYASNARGTSGGTLAGGSSSNSGGGIHAEGKCNIILNSVTIAGCRAEQNWNSDGYGGGIRLAGADTKLTLNDSIITGCLAYNDGGGIYVDNKYGRIEMTNSHIDENYAGVSGGGICLCGSYLYVTGDGKSTVSNNRCLSMGGGIHVYKSDVTISGLILNGNANSNSGGGVSSLGTVSLTNMTVTNNTSAQGGGIYFGSNKCTIASCTVKGNNGRGGVWITTEAKITGATVIKDNSNMNLFMPASSWQSNRVDFDLTKGAEVWVYYNDNAPGPIIVTPGERGDDKKAKNCTKYIHSEQKGFYFGYNPDPAMRKIMRYVGSAPTLPEAIKLNTADINNATKDRGGATNKAGIMGTVNAAGERNGAGEQYNLLRGFFRYPNADTDGEESTSVFYYSDGLFFNDPKDFNAHLGNLSLSLATSGMYLPTNSEIRPGVKNGHYNKHAGGRQFLADIGVSDQDICVNGSYVDVPGPDTIGVMIGKKSLKYSDGRDTGKILVPVVIRSGGYEAEWAGNMTIGEGGDGKTEHSGFATAADSTFSWIEHYVATYGLQEKYKNGDLIFWISGFSRGGATANLTAKRLVEKIDNEKQQYPNVVNSKVFAYCCEAPKGGTDEAQKLRDDYYYCIHNIINTVDVVPYVAPLEMGFKRYGVDHFVPGTDEATTPKLSLYNSKRGEKARAVTTYRDNDALQTKTNDYEKRKAKMLEHLKAINPDIVFDDYFHPMAMDFAPKVSMYENGAYVNNRAEAFVADFIRFLQEGLATEDLSHYSQAVPNRGYYEKNYVTAFREIVKMVMTMDAGRMNKMTSRAAAVMDKMGIGTLLDFYSNVIGNWHNLDNNKKQSWVSFFWKSIEETGAFEVLTANEKKTLEKHFPKLMDMVFRLIDADYKRNPAKDSPISSGWANGMNKTMTYLPTFATFSKYILSCHYPEVAMAWMRTYDSWFNNDYDMKEYTISEKASVNAPKAYIGKSELTPGKDKMNYLTGAPTVIISNDDIVGEAIYYDITSHYDASTNSKVNEIYRAGIGLGHGASKAWKYEIEVYSMSYGVKSPSVSYNFTVYSDKNDVIIPDDNGKTKTLSYKPKDKITVSAPEVSGKFFKEWTVSVLDENGKNPVDVTGSLLAADKGKQNVTFTMPAIDSTTNYKYGYKLKFSPTYNNRIKHISLSGYSKPVGASRLSPSAIAVFDNGASDKSCNMVWYYNVNSRAVPAPEEETAYDNTVYTATITIDPDVAENIVFDSEVEVELPSGTGTLISDTPGKVSRNNSDGSISLKIEFESTGEGTGLRPNPDDLYGLTIQPWDLNKNEIITAKVMNLSLNKNYETVTLFAPDVPDERFDHWNLVGSGLTVNSSSSINNETVVINKPANPAGPYTIKPCYKPIVKEVNATVTAPTAGSALPTTVTSLKVTITNEYEIHPDNIELIWSPNHTGQGETAQFMTAYTANIKVKTYESEAYRGQIRVRTGGGEWQYITPQFIFSEYSKVKVNGNVAACDKDAWTVSCTFPEQKYQFDHIEEPEEITNIPYGTDLTSLLPDTVEMVLSNGDKRDVAVAWGKPTKKSSSSDPRDEAEYSVTGTVTLPDDVDKEASKSLETTIELSVDEADTAALALASMTVGDYESNIAITLSTTTEGGKIYYTTDGKEPTSSSTEYEGEIIYVDWDSITPVDGIRSFILKTITYKAGMFESNVSTYEYTMDSNIDVPDPASLTYNSELQVGIPGSKYYDIVNITGGGIIDPDSGDAKGTEAGDYSATLRIKPGFNWDMGIGDDGKTIETDTRDKVLTFTINPMSLKDTVINVKEDPVALNGGKAEPAIAVKIKEEEIPASDYRAVYSNNTAVGTGYVDIVANDNYIESPPTASFTITDGKGEDPTSLVILKPTSKNKTMNVLIGGEYKIDPTQLIEGNDYTVVSMDTTNHKIATIDPDGTLHMNKKGTTTVKIKVKYPKTVTKGVKEKYTDAKGKTRTRTVKQTVIQEKTKIIRCTLRVKAPLVVTKLRVNTSKTTIDLNKKDRSRTLKVSFTPSKAPNKDVRFESLNPDVVEVTQNGYEATAVVTGLKEGTAKVKVTSLDQNNVSKIVTVKVIDKGRVTGVRLNRKNASVKLQKIKDSQPESYKQKTLQLRATVRPSTARNKNVTWESSDESVATVDAKGKVTIYKPGQVTITATTTKEEIITDPSAGGVFQKSCTIKVK